jgi:hypothetical protein
LSSSLSAAFFANLKGDRRINSADEPSPADDLKEDDDTTEIVKNPYAAGLYAESPKGGSARTQIEARSKETVAAVERMRERLSAMGIIGSSAAGNAIPAGSPTASPARPTRPVLEEATSVQSPKLQELFFPPPPPYSEGPDCAAEADQDNDTASTTSGGSGRDDAADDLDDVLRDEIVQKTKKCNEMLM